MAQGPGPFVLTQNMKHEEAFLKNLQSHFRQEAAIAAQLINIRPRQSLNGGLQVMTKVRQCTEKPKRACANGGNNTGKEILF